MNYTIQKLAELTGTTARTVRFYDQIGLLKPAFIAENGYRYYGDAEVVKLQQITFYKELGLELKQIQEMFDRANVSYEEMLLAQRKVLTKSISKQKKLLKTVVMVLQSHKKAKTMTSQEMIKEHTDADQVRLESIFDQSEIASMKESEQRIKEQLSTWKWVEDWTPYLTETKKIQVEFEKCFDEGDSIDSPNIQVLAKKYFEHGKKIGMTTKEAVLRAGMILRDSVSAEAAGLSPEFGRYFADAMDYFANKNL